MMIIFPIAKINIGLRITAKRADGYHDIETVFYPVRLCDALEFVIPKNNDNKDFLTTTGIYTGSNPEENLVLKAVRGLRKGHSFPYLKIHLHKVIPVSAGLGGGSSDSSCFLKAINRYFKLDISENELKSISLELGSDCPFFIDGIPSYASGRGEVLKQVGQVLKDYYLVLLNPGVGINTREAYQNCRPAPVQSSLSELILSPITEWKDQILNDFEEYAFKTHPVIGDIKNELYNSGAIFSLMSGSGSSVYGIFRERPMLEAKLKKYIIFEGTI